MASLTQNEITQIIEDINTDQEESRRALAHRRHRIYRDGGKEYLLEQLETEFGIDAIAEMRLAPVNYLKPIVNKKSGVFKTPPVRRAPNDTDQALVDFYTEELAWDVKMKKANIFYNLHSNTALYLFPKSNFIQFEIIPPQSYSIVPNSIDQREVDVWVFNRFIEHARIIRNDDRPSPTGVTGFSRNRTSAPNRMVDSRARIQAAERNYIFWTADQHFTTDEEGLVLQLDPNKGDEQFMNPIGMSPVVHLQKDTEEAWATQGEDASDLAIALQLGWTDLLTIAKHQGFAQMVIESLEQPQRMNIGINKVLWLKKFEGQDPPQIKYLTAEPALEAYKTVIQDLLANLLSTNDINPSSVGGRMSGPMRTTSGFHALIEQSDALEAMRADQPVLRDSEKSAWMILARWHNWMFENGLLRDDAKALGMFSPEFQVQITYADVRPLESEQEKIKAVKELMDMGLITRIEALQKMSPDLSDEQAQEKIKMIDEESLGRQQMFLGEPKEDEDGEAEV